MSSYTVMSTSELSRYWAHSTMSQMLFCDAKMTSSGNLYLPFKLRILHLLGMHWGWQKNDIDIHVIKATSQGCLDIIPSQLWAVHPPGTFYQFHHCCYVLFCNKLLPYLLQKNHLSVEPTAKTLSYYITYQTHFISPNSIDPYLSGIINQLKPYYPDVHKQWGSLLVKCTLKGAQRLCSKGVCHKKPLSVFDLDTMWACLAGSTSFNDLLFEAQLGTRFAGLLWLGELVKNNKPVLWDWKKITMQHLLEWLPNTYTFLLPHHKGNLVFEGNHVVCQRITVAPDPVCIMHKYINAQDQIHPLHPQLWLWSDSSPPVCTW